jgi:hypothetical protein
LTLEGEQGELVLSSKTNTKNYNMNKGRNPSRASVNACEITGD